jgi:hypothetical protein
LPVSIAASGRRHPAKFKIVVAQEMQRDKEQCGAERGVHGSLSHRKPKAWWAMVDKLYTLHARASNGRAALIEESGCRA